jgi:3-oxoacyl-[acyl-carrier protein] reductase
LNSGGLRNAMLAPAAVRGHDVVISNRGTGWTRYVEEPPWKLRSALRTAGINKWWRNDPRLAECRVRTRAVGGDRSHIRLDLHRKTDSEAVVMRRLEGKGVLVTGGSRGIGAAIARRLAHEGARMIVNFHTSKSEAEQVVADIAVHEGWAEIAQADIANMHEVQALVSNAAARLTAAGGRLDVLVSNAGIAEPAKLEEIDEPLFDRQFATNVKSVLFGAKTAARIFGDQGGAIINISSVNGRMPAPGAAIYSGTKAAVEAITVALARELGPLGVRVNAVAPGTTATDMTRRVLTAELEAMAVSRTALRRIGAPDDIAKVVAFLASDDAAWITGEIITASGGLR